MAHVVTEPCVNCKNTVCVSVCPVNCFHEDAQMLVIDPDECIDCGACVPECPTKAIFPLAKVPVKWRPYIKLNAERTAVTPHITAQKKPMNDAAPSPDRELWSKPRWRPEDLGLPLPASPHAVSVCLPQWQDVVDYEEKKERVIARLQSGYPRFVIPPITARFFAACRERFARDGERCLAFPTERAARRCVALVRRRSGAEARVVAWPGGGAQVVCYPEAVHESAMKYWRHTGDGISSRRAEALLAGGPEPEAAAHKARVREKIARLLAVPPDHVFLFGSGMEAIYAVHRALEARRPGARSIQVGFPYVDTLKILAELGAGAQFFARAGASDLARVMAGEPIAGVYCEFPSNPLLDTPDLVALAAAARAGGAPLVVDETIASYANVNVLPGADVVVSSLTKFFTGRGTLMAGAAVISPSGPFAAELLAALRAEHEDTIWGGDAQLLDAYSDDFVERMQQVNRTTEQVCDWLRAQPGVETVYYPKLRDRALYDAFRRPAGGYSGLFSLVLKNPAETSERFFNALSFNKGPNLGTTFSLCCPFTLLAHYGELDWAEQCGVSRYLIRFSIGLEAASELIARLDAALRA